MDGSPYTLDQLTGFLAVVDEGSFSAAGRRLGRVQSAISYAVAQLEQALGTRLFDRSGKSPSLTTAGHRLAAEARLVVAQARELTECAAQLRGGIEPELRVVVDVAYPQERLLALCTAFRDRFPMTMLRLELGLLGDAVDAVLRGDADLGACNLVGASPAELALTYLGSVHIVPVCAAAHPLATLPAPQRSAVLAQHTQIVHSERSGPRTADQGVIAARTWRVTDLGAKAELIRRGVGWGSLPDSFAAPYLARGELVRLLPERWPSAGHEVWIHAAVRKEHTLGAAGQWFRDALRLDGAENAGGANVQVMDARPAGNDRLRQAKVTRRAAGRPAARARGGRARA